ncbi:hypothetical protein ACMYSQ_012405 [Aspergillus niger]
MLLEMVVNHRTVAQFQQSVATRAPHPSLRNAAKILIDKGFSQFFRATLFDMMLEVEMGPMGLKGERLVGVG